MKALYNNKLFGVLEEKQPSFAPRMFHWAPFLPFGTRVQHPKHVSISMSRWKGHLLEAEAVHWDEVTVRFLNPMLPLAVPGRFRVREDKEDREDGRRAFL